MEPNRSEIASLHVLQSAIVPMAEKNYDTPASGNGSGFASMAKLAGGLCSTFRGVNRLQKSGLPVEHKMSQRTTSTMAAFPGAIELHSHLPS